MINFLLKYCPMRSGYSATMSTLKRALFARVIRDMLIEVSENPVDVNSATFQRRTTVRKMLIERYRHLPQRQQSAPYH